VTTTPKPIDIATAIADLTPIDWGALEAGAKLPTDRAMLARLRLLDRMVRACANSEAETGRKPDSPTDTTPTAWGPFDIHERVGRGTFGDVYRAHDRRLDRIVALKLLRPDREGSDAIASEAIHEGRLLAKVRHPNVVTVYGAERIDGRVGLWMEFIDGRTLADEVRQSGRLAPAVVADIGHTLCGALAAVHEAGLLHRDLKAQNVMRARDGRIILTDFGAGRAVAEMPSDGRSELAGTPLYLAPEVLAGEPASVASEVYSLGVLLYHLATGSFPVRGRTLRELTEAHARATRVSIRAYRDKLPRKLLGVIERATDPDVTRRFASIEQLGAALGPLKRRTRVVPAAVIGSTVAAALTLAGLNLHWSRNPPLDVVDMKVVRRTPGRDLELVFIKGGLLYYKTGDTLFSSPPHLDAPAETRLDRVGAFQPVDIHPTRDEFLALKMDAIPPTSDRELWVMGMNGQNRRLGIFGSSPSWSRDGLRLAYVNNSQLYIANRDGSDPRKLPTPPQGRIAWPRWSPDESLRFDVATTDRFLRTDSIWEVRSDGTGLRELLQKWNDPPKESYGRFSPDGSFFVFRSQSDYYDLWALRERQHFLDWTRRVPIRLTRGPMDFESGAIVADDNRTLYATGAIPKGQLVRYNRARGAFEPYLGGISATWIAMSPDEGEFVYVSYPDQKLWRSSTDGSNNRRLVNSPAEVDGSMWSPDGRWISFNSRLDGVHMKIFLLRADGSAPPVPIVTDDQEQGFASWALDSRSFVYGEVPPQFGVPTGDEVLHVYELETRTVSTIPESRGRWTARWSPDGRFIAAVTIAAPQSLALFDVKAGSWRPLPAAQQVNNPSWSRDSRFIYYDTQGSDRSLCRVRIFDGRVEVLQSLKDYPTASYGWSGLAPDDSPLLLHYIGTVNIYALTLGRR